MPSNNAPPPLNRIVHILGYQPPDPFIDDVPFPKMEYISFMNFKGVQICSVLGTAGGAIYAAAAQEDIVQTAFMVGTQCMHAGGALGCLVALGNILRAENDDVIKDKVIQFRRSKTLLIADRVSLIGLVVGAIGTECEIFPRGSFLFGFVGGFVLGSLLGGYVSN